MHTVNDMKYFRDDLEGRRTNIPLGDERTRNAMNHTSGLTTKRLEMSFIDFSEVEMSANECSPSIPRVLYKQSPVENGLIHSTSMEKRESTRISSSFELY